MAKNNKHRLKVHKSKIKQTIQSALNFWIGVHTSIIDDSNCIKKEILMFFP